MTKKQTLMKIVACRKENFCILLAFLLITVALLIGASTCCYLVKYQAKQKHLLPLQNANNKLKVIMH